jgi:hypothetical protein
MNTNLRTLSAVIDSPELALFEAFAFRNDRPLSPADASRFSGVTWATAHRKIIDWDAKGILAHVGKEGKADLYMLNSHSETVKSLIKVVRNAVIEILENEEETVSPAVEPVDEPVKQAFTVCGEVDKMKWNSTPMNLLITPAPY